MFIVIEQASAVLCGRGDCAVVVEVVVTVCGGGGPAVLTGEADYFYVFFFWAAVLMADPWIDDSHIYFLLAVLLIASILAVVSVAAHAFIRPTVQMPSPLPR